MAGRSAFTFIELIIVTAVLAVLIVLLLPVTKHRWNADGQSISINNVRRIMQGCDEYRLDHNGMTPMRGHAYSNGQITGGWDTWHFAGKNCSSFWQTSSGGAFDEHAHWRFLNPYLQAAPAPVPTGWVNTGSGTTWTLIQGTLTAAQRAAYSVKVCRSPGDVATRQRAWPSATPGISCYDDVGTSYHVNMNWWSLPGGPASFTLRFNAGAEAIRRLPSFRWYRPPSNFVWISDQIGTVAPHGLASFPGEFGGTNMSVVGFLDGRAAYIQLASNSLSGPGYTFGITWP